MSYTQCPSCGSKALSVATRCPRCGVPFGFKLPSKPPARPRRRGVPVVVTGVALAAILFAAGVLRRGPALSEGFSPPPPAATPAPVRRQPVEPAALPPAPAETPASAPAVTPASEPVELRYTNIWVNVRQARRPSSPVIKVLRPGEPVQVDSLRYGWYRVVADGQAVGYVYRGFVDAEPPGKRN
jgi:hypothetical protein